jgi:hypothetical protein
MDGKCTQHSSYPVVITAIIYYTKQEHPNVLWSKQKAEATCWTSLYIICGILSKNMESEVSIVKNFYSS